MLWSTTKVIKQAMSSSAVSMFYTQSLIWLLTSQFVYCGGRAFFFFFKEGHISLNMYVAKVSFEVCEIMFFKWNQMVGFLLNISSVFLLLYLAMTPACTSQVLYISWSYCWCCALIYLIIVLLELLHLCIFHIAKKSFISICQLCKLCCHTKNYLFS